MTDSPRVLLQPDARATGYDFATPANAPIAPIAPVSTVDATEATWRLARQDQIGAATSAEDEAYHPIVDRLEAIRGTSGLSRAIFGSPYGRSAIGRVGEIGAAIGAGALGDPDAGRALTDSTAWNKDAIWADVNAHPDQFRDVLAHAHDAASFAAMVHGGQARQRAADQSTVSQENAAQKILGFGTGLAAGFADPINLGAIVATGGAGAVETAERSVARQFLVSGLTNAGITAAQEPLAVANRASFGEQTDAAGVAQDLGDAFVGGVAFHGAGMALGAVGKAALASRPGQAVTGALGDAWSSLSDRALAKRYTDIVPPDQRPTDHQAALHVMDRQTDIDATNPYTATPAGMDAHADQLTDALRNLLAPNDRATVSPEPLAATAHATAAPVAAAADLSPGRVIRFVMGDLEGGARVVHYSDGDGGTTRFGIAAKFNPGVDVANLSADQAASIARRKYWLPEYDRADPRTAAVAFDAGYISGPEVGRRILRDSGGDPQRALDLYRGWLDHLADTVPGKAQYRKGWNARVDKLARFVGGSEDRVSIRPEAFDENGDGNGDALASAQRDLDQADMADQLDAHDAAMAREREGDAPPDGQVAPPVLEGSGIGDGAGYFAPRVEGGAEQVITPRGRTVDTQFEVREAGDLIDSGSPAYDPRLQPRDRANRAASDVQVTRMAGELDPQQLGNSRLAAQGAPIIGPDGMVESGNGRFAAIRRAYADHPARAAEYRGMVESRYPEAATMREPVLVRRRTTEMTQPDREAWAAEANERDTMAMSAPEQAGVDARGMAPDVLATYRGGELTDARNRPFVRSFLDKVASPSEINTLVDENGVLNADGLRRMNNAILSRAYEDPALVAQLAEATDTNIKAIGSVLTRIAPAIAQLKDQIATGRVARGFDLAPALTEVATRVKNARDAKAPIDDVLRQHDMFGGGPDAEVAALMRLFFRSEERDGKPVLTRPRSADTITDVLENYVAAARQGVDFFGHTPTAEELIYAKRAEIPDIGDEPAYAARERAGAGDAGDGADASGGRGGSDGDRGDTGAQAGGVAADLAQARGDDGPAPLIDRHLARFDDPSGDGVRVVVDSELHDIRAELDRGAEVDPAVADRQRKEAQLAAASPMRSVADQESTMGLGLFDTIDQPTFQLDEDGGGVDAKAVLDGLDAYDAAIDAAKDCLL